MAMKACTNREETLLLDVYGELGKEEKADWERHVEHCPGCREEREKMLRFLGRIRIEMPPPPFSHEKAGALSGAIKSRLREQGAGPRWWERIIPVPSRTLAALATACCVVVLSGWLALKWFGGPSPHPESPTQAQISRRDIEIIKNMELLEDLETLRKLVQVVDDKDVRSKNHEI
jgi:anti-sigma factor RsiW